MRIAYVCLDPGVPIFGRKGCSIHCQEIIRALRQRGHVVELFATRLGADVPDDLSGIPTHRLGESLSSDPATRERELFALNPIVKSLLADAEPFDLVYERHSLWSQSAMQFSHMQSIPGILEVNAPLVDEQKKHRTLLDESKALSAQNECFRHAKSIIAVSEEVAALIRQNGAARSKTTTVFNGVNCETFDLGTITDHSDRTIIGFVGTLKSWHGVSILLDAFALAYTQNPNIGLKIVGSGPEASNLQNQLVDFPVDVQSVIQWTGAIPNSEMPKVLSTFDIAVAPYPKLVDFYFSPLKVLEYMAAGRAIVASRIGQIPDLIVNNQSGILVQPGCSAGLATAILELCSDFPLRQRLGLQARLCAVADHSWRHVVDRILSSVAEAQTPCGAIQ